MVWCVWVGCFVVGIVFGDLLGVGGCGVFVWLVGCIGVGFGGLVGKNLVMWLVVVNGFGGVVLIGVGLGWGLGVYVGWVGLGIFVGGVDFMGSFVLWRFRSAVHGASDWQQCDRADFLAAFRLRRGWLHCDVLVCSAGVGRSAWHWSPSGGWVAVPLPRASSLPPCFRGLVPSSGARRSVGGLRLF